MKNKILLLIVAIVQIGYSAAAVGTNVGSPIVPTDSNDVYPTHDAIWGKGGYRTVPNTTYRDAIPQLRRDTGMTVFCIADSTTYQLRGGTTNSNWHPYFPASADSVRSAGEWADRKIATWSDNDDPTGFLNRTNVLSWKSGASGSVRRFFITGDHDVYVQGMKRTMPTDSIQIADATGTNFMYYDKSFVLTASTSFPGFNYPLVAIVYFNTTTDRAILLDERHGINMPWSTHKWAHQTVGCRYESGFSLTVSATTPATFSMTAGVIHDEDLVFSIGQKSRCRVLYKNGTTDWEWDSTQTQPYKLNGANIRYNNVNNLEDVGSNRYVCSWIFASNSNDTANSLWCVIGQGEDLTITAARARVYSDLVLPTASPELKILYKIIFQNKSSPFVELQDLRAISTVSSGTYTATAHNNLSGLGFDVAGHTGFASGTNSKADSATNLSGGWCYPDTFAMRGIRMSKDTTIWASFPYQSGLGSSIVAKNNISVVSPTFSPAGNTGSWLQLKSNGTYCSISSSYPGATPTGNLILQPTVGNVGINGTDPKMPLQISTHGGLNYSSSDYATQLLHGCYYDGSSLKWLNNSDYAFRLSMSSFGIDFSGSTATPSQSSNVSDMISFFNLNNITKEVLVDGILSCKKIHIIGTSTAKTNTVIGDSSYLNYNSTGYSNTAIGSKTMKDADGDNYNNTAVGSISQRHLTTGDNNTSIGSGSLQNITSGSSNSALGRDAGFTIGSGSSNILIGDGADVSNESSKLRTTIGLGCQNTRDSTFMINPAQIKNYADSATARAAGIASGMLYRTGQNLKIMY